MVKVNYKEVSVITRCPFCGRANEVEVNEMDYLDWDDGVSAQVAFPYLSAAEREMLISGICPTCWARTFGESEDAENDCGDWDYNEDEGFDPYEGCWTGDC